MRQPTAQQLGLTDDLLSTFLRSCTINEKPGPGSPSSVLPRGNSARFSCSQYLRAVEDLNRYRDDVRKGIVIIGNGRSVLHSHAGSLIDNYGMVVRFNEYQTDGPGSLTPPHRPRVRSCMSPRHDVPPSTLVRAG